MNRSFIAILAAVFLAAGGTLAYAFQQRLKTTADFDNEIRLAQEQAASIHENTVVPTDQRVRAGENFTAVLQKFGLSPEEAAGASAAAQRTFNLRQVRAGNTITVGRSIEGALREIDYKIDSDRMLRITPEDKGYSAQIREIPSHTEVVVVSGKLEDSLFNAVEDAGETAELAMRLGHVSRRPGKKEIRERTDRRVRKNLRRGIRQQRKKISSATFSRSRGAAGLLHCRWKIAAKGFSAFALEIWRAGDFAFQQGTVSSDFENVSRAHGHGLRSAHWDSRANHRQRPSDFRWAQRR